MDLIYYHDFSNKIDFYDIYEHPFIKTRLNYEHIFSKIIQFSRI